MSALVNTTDQWLRLVGSLPSITRPGPPDKSRTETTRGWAEKINRFEILQVRPLDITLKSETFHLHVPATAYLKRKVLRVLKTESFTEPIKNFCIPRNCKFQRGDLWKSDGCSCNGYNCLDPPLDFQVQQNSASDSANKISNDIQTDNEDNCLRNHQ